MRGLLSVTAFRKASIGDRGMVWEVPRLTTGSVLEPRQKMIPTCVTRPHTSNGTNWFRCPQSPCGNIAAALAAAQNASQ
jgi:hypothetical protein